jgi:hypothetical protein
MFLDHVNILILKIIFLKIKFLNIKFFKKKQGASKFSYINFNNGIIETFLRELMISRLCN